VKRFLEKIASVMCAFVSAMSDSCSAHRVTQKVAGPSMNSRRSIHFLQFLYGRFCLTLSP
jgi:hypothetical protein